MRQIQEENRELGRCYVTTFRTDFRFHGHVDAPNHRGQLNFLVQC